MNKQEIRKYFIKRILLIVFISLSSYMARGQQNPSSDLLLGSWTFMEATSIDKMPSDIRQNLTISTELQSHVANYFAGRQLLFNSDGTYTISFSSGESFNGEWNLSNNLLTTVTNGITATQQLIIMNNSHFYLISDGFNNPEARLLFPELHFSKN